MTSALAIAKINRSNPQGVPVKSASLSPMAGIYRGKMRETPGRGGRMDVLDGLIGGIGCHV